MSTITDVKYWKEDIGKTNKMYELWQSGDISDPKAVIDYVTALECYSNALEEHMITLQRRVRRLRSGDDG